MKNIYRDGIMGLVVGDAFGVPYEFSSREEMTEESADEEMAGFMTYNVPAGSWSDDSSMALATLDSLRGGYDPLDIARNFVDWLETGKYTPFGRTFDVGMTCDSAIMNFRRTEDITTCGLSGEMDNGNGSLMRILPACIYFCEKENSGAVTTEQAIECIHEISAITHAHLRSRIACGLYYFIVKEIINGEGELNALIQAGIDRGFAFYTFTASEKTIKELSYYSRMRDIDSLIKQPADNIVGSGYVVQALEAALWSLATTDSYKDCILRAVNLGNDTDTTAAIAGGLAGLYYGYDSIPAQWLEKIAKRAWIEQMCGEM